VTGRHGDGTHIPYPFASSEILQHPSAMRRHSGSHEQPRGPHCMGSSGEDCTGAITLAIAHGYDSGQIFKSYGQRNDSQGPTIHRLHRYQPFKTMGFTSRWQRSNNRLTHYSSEQLTQMGCRSNRYVTANKLMLPEHDLVRVATPFQEGARPTNSF
jgi:hypothetical protein